MEAAAQGQDKPRPSEVVGVTSPREGNVLAFLEDGRVAHGKIRGSGEIGWTGLEDAVPGTPAASGGGTVRWR